MIGERFLGPKITRRNFLSGVRTTALGIAGIALVRCTIAPENSEQAHHPRRAIFLYPDQLYLGRDQYLKQFDEVFEAAHYGSSPKFTRITNDRFSEGTCLFETPDGKLITLERGEHITGQTFRYVTISSPNLLSPSTIPGVVNEEKIVYLKFEGLPRSNPTYKTVIRKWPYRSSMTREEYLIHATMDTLLGMAREFTNSYNWALENGRIKV